MAAFFRRWPGFRLPVAAATFFSLSALILSSNTDAGSYSRTLASRQFRFRRHELASERLRENCLRQLLRPQRRRSHSLVNCISKLEKGFYSSHDFLLFFDWRQCNNYLPYIVEIQSRLASSVGIIEQLSSTM